MVTDDQLTDFCAAIQQVVNEMDIATQHHALYDAVRREEILDKLSPYHKVVFAKGPEGIAAELDRLQKKITDAQRYFDQGYPDKARDALRR